MVSPAGFGEQADSVNICAFSDAVFKVISVVSEYVPDVWHELQPRHRDFGIEVPAISTDDLWQRIAEFGLSEIDLLKLDCEGAEYLILPELSRLGLLHSIGWIRGEWHSCKDNPISAAALKNTHSFNIDPNQLRGVGLFVGHCM